MAYTIEGTNETYDGKVVRVGDYYYTTEDGALSGFSKRLVETATGDNINQSLQSKVEANQDVVTAFVTGDGSKFGKRNRTYYYADGRIVPRNTELHHHSIRPTGRLSNFMTQHVMDGNDVDVFTTKPTTRSKPKITTRNTSVATTRTTTQQTTTQQTTPTTTTPTPGGTGGGTGGSTGGGTGGGGY